MPAQRDPFQNPFPDSDPDRRQIWEMLVPRDIDAFVTADWSKVADDFINENFTSLSGHFQNDPGRYDLAYPTLVAYRDDWLRQAQDFGAPRAGIFLATRPEDIVIDGAIALVRKKSGP